MSAGLLLNYLQTSLFIPLYQTAVGIISPLKLDKEASNFQYKLWKNHDLTVQPVITNIYFVSHGMHSGYLVFLTIIL
jgi:hypothetical protein